MFKIVSGVIVIHKHSLKVFPYLFLLLLSLTVTANEATSYGVGIGNSYSGLGINYGLLSEVEFKYVSTGVLGYSSLSGNIYGFGMGWMKTNLFDSKTPKHGANIYVGIMNNNDKYNNAAYIGAGYLYFFNGIKNPGKTIGFTLVNGNEVDEFELKPSFQFAFGYQF